MKLHSIFGLKSFAGSRNGKNKTTKPISRNIAWLYLHTLIEAIKKAEMLFSICLELSTATTLWYCRKCKYIKLIFLKQLNFAVVPESCYKCIQLQCSLKDDLSSQKRLIYIIMLQEVR